MFGEVLGTFLFPSWLAALGSPLLYFSYFHAGPPARVLHMSSELCEMAARLKAEKMKSKEYSLIIPLVFCPF